MNMTQRTAVAWVWAGVQERGGIQKVLGMLITFIGMIASSVYMYFRPHQTTLCAVRYT